MNYSKKILDKLNSITAKRPKTVIQHIMEHGYVTTEELENLYGYKHAPRAARVMLGNKVYRWRRTMSNLPTAAVLALTVLATCHG